MISLEFLGEASEFYDYNSYSNYGKVPSDAGKVLKYTYLVSDVKIEHYRQVYTLLDCIGDIGGLFDGLGFLFEIAFSIGVVFGNVQFPGYLVRNIFLRKITNKEQGSDTKVKQRFKFRKV